MRPEEVRAVGRLGARVFADAVSHVEQVHGAIAARAFRPARVAGAPARRAHDAIAKAVYATVRGTGRGAGLATGEAVSLVTRPGQHRPMGSTRAGNVVSAVLNAAVGDRLAARHDPLAIVMAVRAGARDVPARRDRLEPAFPGATPKLAVFLHGLGETDESWQRHAGQAGGTYGSRLGADLGYTAVYVRYNTGRHISDNGHELARLLTDVVAAWPTSVEEITLVGHSMGGLVARSACHYGAASGEPWVSLVHHVFYLGSPHAGASLERLVSRLGWALDRVAETKPYASLVNVRSAGIKDLRFGYVVDEDWAGCDADTCLQNHRHEVPLLATANHYVISAALAGDPRSPGARMFGDLLVNPASASGRHRRGQHVAFPADNSRHFDGLHHFDLLNHPAVYDAIRAWLDPPLPVTV